MTSIEDVRAGTASTPGGPTDRLAFGTPEKADRYRTERYPGAAGLNWYAADPTLQFMMNFYLRADELAWAEPHLYRLGALMGGPVAERAELTDKNPPRLERYDRWGHEVSEVVLPESALATKRDLREYSFSNPRLRADARGAGVRLTIPSAAYTYLLNQAEVGMTCAMGTGGDMVARSVAEFAPPDVAERVLPHLQSGDWLGETAQLFTERTGGSDLAALETTAVPAGDAWLLNGVKWFASNANGQAYVVLAKPVGAPDTGRGVATFLVLRERRDGGRNGVRIRRLKDKLGTKAVASAEVEFVDAEAFLLGGEPGVGTGAGDGRALARMMEMTNSARIGVASMGLGCARRALVEALCYARARSSFGQRLVDAPLMRRKLAELVVEVEAAQALVFDNYGVPNQLQPTGDSLRIGAPLAKLRAARLGITAASDAIEIHGGNGYVETWPVARILRDAQVNTVWEGPDNILCLDIRRGIERAGADGPLVERLRAATAAAPSGDSTAALVDQRIDDLAGAIAGWKRLDRTTGEYRLFDLAQFMVDVYAGALLVEQASWERATGRGDRKALVAELYADRHLAGPTLTRGVDAPPPGQHRFAELVAGALVDDRP